MRVQPDDETFSSTGRDRGAARCRPPDFHVSTTTRTRTAYSGFVVAVEAPDGCNCWPTSTRARETIVAQADLDLSWTSCARPLWENCGPEVTTVTTGEPDVDFFRAGIGVDSAGWQADLIDENAFLTLESDGGVLERAGISPTKSRTWGWRREMYPA